ncbi:MAG: hypothetical protein EPN97_15585 [Alphaproteobacteria bacterium]|nr:MAG: hypothetical protein EPN97_15585 [Alphaproteobacteria bacterium]
MSELQAPNWNEAKIDPQDLSNKVSARLETIAKEHNANPSKFMAQLKGGGDTFGFNDMKVSNQGQTQEKPASSSSFLLMGKGRNKKDVRWEQLKSENNAMGLPKTYREKLTDSRILAGGRAKKNHDPFSGGGDRALLEQARIARQSLGTEGGYVSPQGIKANAHLAAQLGGAELFSTMLDARREDQAPAEYRALNGAADGNDKLKDAAKQVSDDVKVEFVKKQDDPKPLANMLLSEEAAEKAKQPIDAPKPKHLEPPKPPAPSMSSSNGLMGEG